MNQATMNIEAEIKRLDPAELFSLTGVHERGFRKLVSVVRSDICTRHMKGGRPFRIMPITRVFITLFYLKTALPMAVIALLFNISKGTVSKIFHRTIGAVICSGFCRLKGQGSLAPGQMVLLDATETPINRPKHGQRSWYSGKKKRHTIKTQVIMDEATGEVVDIQFAKGAVHDYTLFKDTCKVRDSKVVFVADKGYQGIQNRFPLSDVPIKNTKSHPVGEREAEYNKLVGAVRMPVEHVNAWLKRFRAIHDRYRGQRGDFWKPMLVIVGIYNHELASSRG